MTARSPTKGALALAETQARKPQGTLSFLELDITSDASIASFVEKVTSEYGVVDVLVNNAGITNEHKGGEYTRDMAFELFNVNVFGHAFLTRALEPLLRKASDGTARIINVSSILGSLSRRFDPSNPGAAVPADFYRMSKAALNIMTGNQNYHYKGWAKAWAYCPGYVITNLTGEGDRQLRKDTGAETSLTSAEGILSIVNGERDEDWDKFVRRRGETIPW